MVTVTIRQPVDAADLVVGTSLEDTDLDRTDDRPADVFPQSVASGGPTPTGIVLWTRIHPDRYDPTRSLRLEVATDESFDDPVVRAVLPGPGVKPTDNYTLRVDLDGVLEPDSVYFYRFGYRGVRSPTGRCRTLPGEDRSPESVTFGVLNCQHYQHGRFGAIANLAAADVDFVLHLGDYVYDDVGDGPYDDRRIELPDGETHPMSLDDFRHLYEVYKAEPSLQRLHERHTVIQTWDDHAIANDRYWDYERDAPVFPDHPCGDVPAFTRYLTRAGIQAWWEFVPARITYDPTADHLHDSFELYTATRFGDLLTLVLTDERLFRSRPHSRRDRVLPWDRADSSHTILGRTQREWFLDTLRGSETRWTAWANAVLFAPLVRGLWKDSWDGFAAERATIAETMAAVRDQTSVVLLTGDMHMTLATRLRAAEGDGVIGVEFMTPSVTSVTLSETIDDWIAGTVRNAIERLPASGRIGADRAVPDGVGAAGARLANRIATTALQRLLGFALADCANWGYSVVTFSRDACTWDVYWVDKTVDASEAEPEPAYGVDVPVSRPELRERHESVPTVAVAHSNPE
ncbi:alkaline phosphatase D family protein [Halovivax limisalsi]|uniref:alkaline phosphatase D family protein n=1 Tax=Halovivax limisalsi TaxID=1453760 RepID=UPI001FFD03A0|nr:alkaline phosphatase D family protein [Halovivax limisalsi]